MRRSLVSLVLLTACSGGEDGVDYSDVLGILISPEAVIVPEGDSVQLQARGLREDRTSVDLTDVVTWDARGSISVSNDLDSEGLLSGDRLGGGAVWAELEGILSEEVSVTVTDAELLGLSVEPDAVTVAEGKTTQLTATATWSDGTRADASSQVRWIIDDGDVATVSSAGLVSGVEAGGTSIVASWDDHSSDDIPVTVVAGASDADLVISELEGEASDTEITLTIRVENLGDVGASDFFVDAYLDFSGTPTAYDYGDAYTLVDYVGPGDTEQIVLSFDAEEGSHTVTVMVDSGDYVSEENEDNNLASGSIDVSADAGDGPNLEVTYFDYIADDTYIYYLVDITNSGSEDVDSFFVDVFVDAYAEPELYDDGDDYTTITSLEAGGTTYADFLIEEYCYYACYSYVLIDGYDYVEETDETDNVSGPLYVYSE